VLCLHAFPHDLVPAALEFGDDQMRIGLRILYQ
jgi:hypothetical protein